MKNQRRRERGSVRQLLPVATAIAWVFWGLDSVDGIFCYSRSRLRPESGQFSPLLCGKRTVPKTTPWARWLCEGTSFDLIKTQISFPFYKFIEIKEKRFHKNLLFLLFGHWWSDVNGRFHSVTAFVAGTDIRLVYQEQSSNCRVLCVRNGLTWTPRDHQLLCRVLLASFSFRFPASPTATCSNRCAKKK